MMDAKYGKVEIWEVIDQQKHLTLQQRNQLYHRLMKYTKLFDGPLGKYKH